MKNVMKAAGKCAIIPVVPKYSTVLVYNKININITNIRKNIRLYMFFINDILYFVIIFVKLIYIVVKYIGL